MREGRYAGEALEKIQRHPLAFEQGARRPLHVRDAVAFLQPVAVMMQERELDAGTELVDRAEHRRSRQDHGLAGQEVAGGASPLRHAGPSRYIARPYVFGKREFYQLVK